MALFVRPFVAMNFAKKLYGDLVKLNLWIHACVAVAGVVLLFAIPVFPFANASSNGFRWLYMMGGVLIFGIGDGHPSWGMKMSGGIILALLALVILCTLVLNFSLFARLLLQRTKSWRFRMCLFTGVASVLAFSFFMAWVSN